MLTNVQVHTNIIIITTITINLHSSIKRRTVLTTRVALYVLLPVLSVMGTWVICCWRIDSSTITSCTSLFGGWQPRAHSARLTIAVPITSDLVSLLSPWPSYPWIHKICYCWITNFFLPAKYRFFGISSNYIIYIVYM